MSAANRLLFVLWLLATAVLLVLAVIGADESTRLYFSTACQVLVSLGAAKAEALFRPVLDALASAGHPGR